MSDIKDKMQAALQDHSDLYAGCSNCGHGDKINEIGFNNPEEVVQSVINAAWSKFKKDDESTWPTDDIFSLLLVEGEEGDFRLMSFGTFHEGQLPRWELYNANSKPVKYLDVSYIRSVNK